MSVCWGTRGVKVTSSWWTWWALCILFTVAPSSAGCCLRLTALRQRPVWQHRTQLLGREDGERSRGGAELPSALRRQTAWWGRRWLSSWPGEVILLPSRVVVQELPRRRRDFLRSRPRGWLAGVQGLRQSVRSRWAGEGRRRGGELPSDTGSVALSTLPPSILFELAGSGGTTPLVRQPGDSAGILDWKWGRHWPSLQDSSSDSWLLLWLLTPPLTPDSSSDSCSGLLSLQCRTAPALRAVTAEWSRLI